MGFRFHRSIRLIPGVRINLSRRGISTTIGPRGASVNVGSRGTYANLGIPGTGVSSRTRLASAGHVAVRAEGCDARGGAGARLAWPRVVSSVAQESGVAVDSVGYSDRRRSDGRVSPIRVGGRLVDPAMDRYRSLRMNAAFSRDESSRDRCASHSRWLVSCSHSRKPSSLGAPHEGGAEMSRYVILIEPTELRLLGSLYPISLVVCRLDALPPRSRRTCGKPWKGTSRSSDLPDCRFLDPRPPPATSRSRHSEAGMRANKTRVSRPRR